MVCKVYWYVNTNIVSLSHYFVLKYSIFCLEICHEFQKRYLVNSKKIFIEEAGKENESDFMFQFLLRQAQHIYHEMSVFLINDHDKYTMPSKKEDICENTLLLFNVYYDATLMKILHWN